MTLELHNSPYSTCSQKSRMCMHEKGLQWTNINVDLLKFEQLRPEYLAINPNGVIPTLVHDGVPIVDSSVIIEYLDEVFPQPPLSPHDPKKRAHMRAWMRYLEEVPTQAIRVPTFNSVLRQRLEAMSQQEYESITQAMPVRKQFYRRFNARAGGFDDRDTRQSMERLRNTLKRVDESVAEAPWLCGNAFSLADITLMPTVVRLEDLGLAHLWADLPACSAWYQRLQARPAFGLTYGADTRELIRTAAQAG